MISNSNLLEKLRSQDKLFSKIDLCGMSEWLEEQKAVKNLITKLGFPFALGPRPRKNICCKTLKMHRLYPFKERQDTTSPM